MSVPAVYFWGTLGSLACPALWEPPSSIVRFKDLGLSPTLISRIDGGYAPGSRRVGDVVCFPRPEERFPNLLRHYFEESWTILSAWEAGGMASANLTFLIRGLWDSGRAVELAKSAWPEVWKRFPDSLTLTGS